MTLPLWRVRERLLSARVESYRLLSAEISTSIRALFVKFVDYSRAFSKIFILVAMMAKQ